MIKAYLLYTGPDEHSHFKEGYLEEQVFTKVNSFHVKESPSGASYDWHTAPTTQYVVCLSGILEFNTFLNEKFHLHPGEILIAMDTTGSGHNWKIINNEPWKRAYVTFETDNLPNFKESLS